MFSHVMLGANDIGRLANFYDALLAPLGLRRRAGTGGGPPYACWAHPDERLPHFFIQHPIDGAAATVGNGVMLAFLAPDHAAVDTAYAAGLAAGGTDAGTPGLRPHYGAGYYGAYLRDPEGNKVHVVVRGDLMPGDSTASA